MSTPRKSSSTAPRKTTSAFAGPASSGPLTRKRIAEDLAAFDRAGGKIETLGNTPLRGKPESPKPSGRGAKPAVATPAPEKA